MYVNILTTVCVTDVLDGRGFAEHHFSRFGSVKILITLEPHDILGSNFEHHLGLSMSFIENAHNS